MKFALKYKFNLGLKGSWSAKRFCGPCFRILLFFLIMPGLHAETGAEEKLSLSKNVTAVFERSDHTQTYILRVGVHPSMDYGTISGFGPDSLPGESENDPLSAEIFCPHANCRQEFPAGTSIILITNPEPGFSFVEWAGDLSGKENPTSLLMDSPKQLVAIFKSIGSLTEYTLYMNVSPPNSGILITRVLSFEVDTRQTIADVSCYGSCSQRYPEGTRVFLNAVPRAGYIFGSWQGDAQGTDNPFILTLTGSRKVSALFKIARDNPDLSGYNSPPDNPLTVSPPMGDVLPAGPVLLTANPFSDPEKDRQTESLWVIRRIDRPDIKMVFRSTSRAEQEVTDLEEGMRYAWGVGYRDEGSGTLSWSDESWFTIGVEKTIFAGEILPGTLASDFRMISVPYWVGNHKDIRFLVNGTSMPYTTANFRLGTYLPEMDDYAVYGSGISIFPGRAYWILSRFPVTVQVEGVPVHFQKDIDVKLHYEPETRNGWNMIGSPNGRDYAWADLPVVVRDDSGNLLQEPVPVISLAHDNPFVDRRILKWSRDDADYKSYAPESNTIDFAGTIVKNDGCWVRARQSNVYLRFPAQPGSVREGGRSVVISEKSASSDIPPMPMNGIEVSGRDPGCFLSLSGSLFK